MLSTCQLISFSARILHVLPHQGPVRRDWAQHLQTLPDIWECDLNYIPNPVFFLLNEGYSVKSWSKRKICTLTCYVRSPYVIMRLGSRFHSTAMAASKYTISALPLAPPAQLLTHQLTPDPRTPSVPTFRNEVLATGPSIQRRARTPSIPHIFNPYST